MNDAPGGQIELWVRVGEYERCIGLTDYAVSVPDLLRAAADVWEFGHVRDTAGSLHDATTCRRAS